jgi:serine/threonine protein kinase/tetratricopeptide (TPR) repeat protein
MKRREIEHYEILKKLGSGGSGVVYLANDTLLMRPVVLKILKRGALAIEQMRTTVLREARLASAIEHPNVCAIYEVGESADEAYIVMQYVPGRSLDRVIAQGPANVPLVLSVGIQIADGLSAAHQIGIYHRDLKPANVMLTDGGLVKILDFGLARRKNPDEAEFDPAQPTRRKQGAVARTYSVRGGTLAYMAPEQFVTGQSSVQSDLFAFGVILYELVSGRHPFVRPDAEELQGVRAIQFADPPALTTCCPETPDELSSVIDRCLKKNPADRYASAAEVREALKTIMRTKQFETGMPFELPANVPPAEQEKRSTGVLSMLAERFRESADEQAKENSILVLPFRNFGQAKGDGQRPHPEDSPMYGFALADAIAARLARMPSLVVRPSSALMQLPLSVQQMDPLALGQRLLARYVLAGNFLRSDDGFDLNWQLLDVAGQSVRTGGAIRVASFDLIAVQTEISNEVFATLQGMGQKLNGAHGERSMRTPRLGEKVSEEYLQARALLSSFLARAGSRSDLDRALAGFERVVERDPQFAAAWSGLGIVHLQYVRNGFGGQMHLLSARRAFDKALELDSGSIEANLYRVYMMLSRGEKQSARHGIEQLLRTTGNDWNVHAVAGITLRLDGMYEDALAQFNRSLQLNPSSAPTIYNHRARVYQYQNQLELAEEELQKGLTLEPKHSLLRTSLAYQHMRKGELETAISLLEAVIRDDDSMRIAFPTLAMCYVQVGQREKAASLIEEDSLSAAEADSEMAYRLATYFAVEGDESEALHWLRRAIYLGNENYPWFSKNPAWQRLHTHADFERILEDLKKSYRKNQKTWRRLLEHVPQG